MSSRTKATVVANAQGLIAGTQKNTPKGSFTFGNKTYTALALIKLLQSLITAMTKQMAQAAAAKDALGVLHEVEDQVLPVMQGYKDFLQTQLGGATQTLADYGLKPRKKAAQASTADKAAAQAKGKKTRELRGTKGPKAKLAIKGTTEAPAEETPAVTTTAPPAKPAS